VFDINNGDIVTNITVDTTVTNRVLDPKNYIQNTIRYNCM